MGVVDARWSCQTAVGVSKDDVHAGNARWYWRSPASIVRATAADIDSDEGRRSPRTILVEAKLAGPHDGEGPRPVFRRRRRTSCSSTTTGSSARITATSCVTSL